MWALAWRNVWRQRSRSLAAAGAVAVVVWLSLVYFGLVGAVSNGIRANLTDATGHLQVHVAGYRDVRDFQKSLIRNAAAVRARLEAAAPGAEVVAALDVPALLAGESRSRGVVLVGVEQPAAARERFARQRLAEGRLPRDGELDAIALGGGLARTLEVGLGGTVYAYAPGTEGTGASAFTVAGLLRFPDPAADARSARLSLAAAQDLAAPGAVTRFELRFPQFTRGTDDARLVTIEARVQDALGPAFSVETWRQVNPALARLEELISPITMVFVAFFFVLAGLLVVNTIYLSLIERIREFGVIIALGASRTAVTRMVLLEGVLLCAAGGTVGLALGLLSVASLARGFAYPLAADVTAQFGLPSVMYASIQPVEVVITVVFTVVTGVLAAVWPARVASRLEPVEAMRFVA